MPPSNQTRSRNPRWNGQPKGTPLPAPAPAPAAAPVSAAPVIPAAASVTPGGGPSSLIHRLDPVGLPLAARIEAKPSPALAERVSPAQSAGAPLVERLGPPSSPSTPVSGLSLVSPPVTPSTSVAGSSLVSPVRWTVFLSGLAPGTTTDDLFV